ncbi:MAG: hypothetical protein K8F91_02570 [Candidatus Obscuribacterales bacterium]|nr:hypothetical protein [Candidatus Obscuribacterales bacterium]
MNALPQLYDTQSVRIQLTSLPSRQRPGYYALIVLYAFAWAFVVVWYIAALYLYPHSIAYAAMIGLVNTAFALYLFFAYRKLRSDTANQFVIEILGDYLHRFVLDRDHNQRKYSRLDLNEVVSCKHYAYKDSASLVLKTVYNTTMELPLSAMPERGKIIVDHLKNRGIEIFSVNI